MSSNNNGNISECQIVGNPVADINQIKLNLSDVYVPLQDTLKVEGKKFTEITPSTSERMEGLLTKILSDLKNSEKTKRTDFPFDYLNVSAKWLPTGNKEIMPGNAPLLAIKLSIPSAMTENKKNIPGNPNPAQIRAEQAQTLQETIQNNPNPHQQCQCEMPAR